MTKINTMLDSRELQKIPSLMKKKERLIANKF